MDQMPGSFPPPPGNEPPSPFSSPVSGFLFPLDIGRIFSLTFALFREQRRTLVGIALVVMIPAALVFAASDVFTGGASDDLITQLEAAARDGIPRFESATLALIGLSLLVSAFYAVATYVAEAGITKAAMDGYGGVQPDATDSTRFGLGRLVTLTAAYLVTFAASFAVIFFGAILASVAFLATGSGGAIVRGPGIFIGLIIFVAAFAALVFLTVRWSLVVPVVVIERRGALESLGRSWRLVAGSSWRVLGYVIAFSVLVAVIAFAVLFVLSLIVTAATVATRSEAWVESISPLISFAAAVAGAVLLPIPAIGFMLLYLDLRFRKGEQIPLPGQLVAPEPPPGPPVF